MALLFLICLLLIAEIIVEKFASLKNVFVHLHRMGGTPPLDPDLGISLKKLVPLYFIVSLAFRIATKKRKI